MKLFDLKTKWENNKEAYKVKEVGSGVHSFIKDILIQLLELKENPVKKTGIYKCFVHDTEATKNGRPDFVAYVSSDIEIPIEAKCYTRIDEGVNQLFRYQLDYGKQYGILTDGYEWRFYRASTFRKLTLNDIFANPLEFVVFWNEYIKLENYYKEVLLPEKVGMFVFERTPLKLDKVETRSIFFDDTTKLITKFRSKMKAIGAFDNLFNQDNNDKIAVETSYSYVIQFILYKVIVDNRYTKFEQEYENLLKRIQKAILDEDFYSIIINEIRTISEYISENIYKPFEKEQKSINEKLKASLHKSVTIDDIAPWLDIIVYINKYDFSNLKNEIFGFVYENYLKDLYQDKDKGQYFTDPDVVNLMLDELGYTEVEIKKRGTDISIIDPSCGAGTFLYSAVNKIIDTYDNGTEEKSKYIENLVDRNIFGLDIEEFPLYLAEMSVLMRMLPLIINDNFENPIDEKFKLFKTEDSISEFVGVVKCKQDVDLFSHLEETHIGYPSFMRDENDLKTMFESLRMTMGKRTRFDFVIGNPPYIGYNECCKQQVKFTEKIKNKNDNSITMGNVFGVNLNTVPNRQKPYSPKPNLYSFFVALGLALLKEGGKICYIVPQTILTAGDLDVLRYHLSKFTTIHKILTFEGNLFVGRGLKQNKPVATSSLIFVASNTLADRDHKVQIVNYLPYIDKKGVDLHEYLHSGKREVRDVLQSELQLNIENWNYIKMDDSFIEFSSVYQNHSHSIEEYRKLDLKNYDEITLDGNINIENKKISKIRTTDDYMIPSINSKGILINHYRYFDKSLIIKKAQGSQDLKKIIGKHYKILWRYQNPKGFNYSEEKSVLPNFGIYCIASNNKSEILFLLSILRCSINNVIINSKLKNENEKSLLLGLGAIKQYIRIPIITEKNIFIKDEIISRTSEMIFLEQVKLKDIIDFTQVTIQKFDSVDIVENKLVLNSRGREFGLDIHPQYLELVKSSINFDNEVSIQELKNLVVFDKEYQSAIKNYLDDLLFALYFNVQLKEIGFKKADSIKNLCSQSKFYNFICGLT